MRTAYVKITDKKVTNTMPLVKNKVILDLDDNMEVVGVEFLDYKSVKVGGSSIS